MGEDEGDYAPVDMVKWLFICGPARTSSTLLAQLLSLHPECTILHKSAFPRKIIDAVYHEMPALIEYNASDENGEWWRAPLMKWDKSCGSAAEGFNAVRNLFKPCAVFGDKIPSAVFIWRGILSIIPNALFVVTWRDRGEIYDSHRRRMERDARFAEIIRSRSETYIDESIAASIELMDQPMSLLVEHNVLQAQPKLALSSVFDFVGLSMDDYPVGDIDEFFQGRKVLS